MTQSQGALALNPSPFTFEDHPVRVIMRNGEPWFVAADVCRALKLTNSRMALRALDEDEKGVSSTDTLGGDQSVAVISEPGLHTLILRCRDAVKPGTLPHRFRRWVTHEVLPSIRKTGGYSTLHIDPAALLLSGQSDPVLLPPEVEQALHRRTWELTREAYDLIEEHLRRRVACWSYAGYPEKVINIDSALHALDTLGDLGEALAHAYLEKVDQIGSYCNAMGRELRNTHETMQTLLAQHGLRASI